MKSTHFGKFFKYEACQCYSRTKKPESFTKSMSNRGRKAEDPKPKKTPTFA